VALKVNEFMDARDCNVYKTETFGGRVWMKENLNYSANNTLGWCYLEGGTELGKEGADGEGCDKPYGRVYTQRTAIDRNICPAGWHLPSVAEWNTISGSGKMQNDFYVIAGNFNANPNYSLGWRERCTTTNCIGNGFYWTNQNAYFYMMQNTSYLTAPSNQGSASPTNDYYSVRCIKDDIPTPSSSSLNSLSSSSSPNGPSPSSSSRSNSSSSGSTDGSTVITVTGNMTINNGTYTIANNANCQGACYVYGEDCKTTGIGGTDCSSNPGIYCSNLVFTAGSSVTISGGTLRIDTCR
jgi:uncharacterized protein (TIGR02145 family)